MATVPNSYRYTKEHEYLKPADKEGEFFVGITDYAQGELGDIVYVELPEPGARVERGQVLGTIEAVKAVAELYAPISGEVVARNERLRDEPQLVNQDPYGGGWMVRLRATRPEELAELLDADAYRAHIAAATQGG
jgi:glycine cleavage system H protein